jgi:hypothetical protein
MLTTAAKTSVASSALLRQAVAKRVPPGGQQVLGKEEAQEGKGACQVFGAVLQCAPGRGDAEGGEKAQQVQGPPCPQRSHGDDAAVEQQVVAKQAHVVALASGRQHGRSERTRKADKGHGLCVLQQGDGRREHTHQCQQRKRGTGRQQLVQAERSKDGEVKHTYTCTLQTQRIGAARGVVALAPAQSEKHHGHQADAGQAHFGRQQGVLDRILGQEG